MTLNTQHKTPKQVVSTFKKILKEASEMFNRPMSDVSSHQFSAASAGRLGHWAMAKCGGFAKLKDYVAPKAGVSNKDTIDMLKRILGK